jgi:GntR family transcriptional repressor for pyruvate dehydrogenase complex
MAINKIEKQSVADRVFNALRQEILDQSFPVGGKLPSEGALSKQFGVSKASVKSALQRLATLGLIETRVGQGSFVREFNPLKYMDQIHEFLLSNRDISQITEYRMYMEMAGARLAIKKAKHENFEQMESLLRQMEEAREKNDVVLHGKLDYQFHLEICRATQNDIVVQAYEIIGRLLVQHTTILNDGYFKKISGQALGEDVHRKLYQAIKSGDLAACRRCYIDMFSVFENLEEEDFADT